MLDITFPPQSTLYTPTAFLADSTFAQTDGERLDLTLQQGSDRVVLSLIGTDEGDFFSHSLGHTPGFARLLRDMVGETGGYCVNVDFRLLNPLSGENKTLSYKFVSDRFADPDFVKLRNLRLPLSAAAQLPRRVCLDTAAPEVLSLYVYNPGGKPINPAFELVGIDEAAAREWSVNGWLEESNRNGTISYLRLPSSSAKASAADRELEDLRPALLRVWLPSCTLEFPIEPAGDHPVAVVEFANRYGFYEPFYFFGGWEEQRKVDRKETDLGDGAEVYRTTEEQTLTLRTGPLHHTEQLLFEDMLLSRTVTLRALGSTPMGLPMLIDSHDLKRSSDPYGLPEGTLKLRPAKDLRFGPLPPLHPATFDRSFAAPFD